MAKNIKDLSKSLRDNLDLTAYSQVGHTHQYAGSSTVGGSATSAVKLATARAINGTNFDGTAAITTAKWGTARTLTIGNSGKSVDGSDNVSWTLTEIGAAASGHTHTIANITDLRIKNGASGVTVADPYQSWAHSDVINNDILFGGSYSHTSANANIVYCSAAGKLNMIIDGEYYAAEGKQRVYHTGYKPTPSDIGAAAESHGTHVTYASAAPKANGTAAIGSSSKVAREDHVHPLQTTVSGNAGSADKLTTARTITIGNKSNTFDGTANITYTLSEIGAAATSHTHNYAGSSSAGGAANSVANNLKIQLNGGSTEGTNLFTYNGSGAKSINITPSSIGAATSSHGTHVSYSTTTPLVAGTGAIGSESSVARGDHVHPAQTSVTGNAGTATTLQTARNIQIGNKTNSFNGSANITYSLSDIGALPTAGGTMTGNITFSEVTSTTYPAKSATITWNGSTDGADIYYQVDASDKGRLVLNTRDDADCIIAFANKGTFVSTIDNSGNFSGKAATAGTADKATKLATARTITIGGQSQSFDGSGNISFSVASIGASESGHTHNYAGSSSAGGAANSVKTNLVIKLNNGGTEGTNLFTFNGSTAKTVNITPSAIGAAAETHGTHVTYSTTTPKVAGTAAVGSESGVSRGDHVHPAQTSVTGNAGTATKLATARTLTIGNTGKTFDGSDNVFWTAAEMGVLPLTGNTGAYSMTGNVEFASAANGTFRGVVGKCGVNDYWRVVGNATADNAGYMEIATADDGTEPIYVRQYTGVYTTVTRTLTLLDGSGNTSMPGNLSVSKGVSAQDITAKGNVTVTGTVKVGSVTMKYNDTSESLDFIFG